MYEEQELVISIVMDEIREKDSYAYRFIQDFVANANSGLEYYGMLNGALIELYDRGILPQSYETKLEIVNNAVKEIFTTKPNTSPKQMSAIT